jgi:tRNA(fMet)-specific endonuclease VapC
MRCLWDTDVVSGYRKGKNPNILHKALLYLGTYRRAIFSLITRYEILRGLKAKNAKKQLVSFETFCQQHDVLPVTEPIIVIAADIWASLRQAGTPIGDDDIFIAATALHHGLALATGNVAHFSRIPGLILEDWTKP